MQQTKNSLEQQGQNITMEELFKKFRRGPGTCGILEIPIITLSECVNVIWKRLCVSVFDSSRTQAAMLTLEEEDRSPLLWEKPYGKAALQRSVVFAGHVSACSCKTCKVFVKGSSASLQLRLQHKFQPHMGDIINRRITHICKSICFSSAG